MGQWIQNLSFCTDKVFLFFSHLINHSISHSIWVSRYSRGSQKAHTQHSDCISSGKKTTKKKPICFYTYIFSSTEIIWETALYAGQRFIFMTAVDIFFLIMLLHLLVVLAINQKKCHTLKKSAPYLDECILSGHDRFVRFITKPGVLVPIFI